MPVVHESPAGTPALPPDRSPVIVHVHCFWTRVLKGDPGGFVTSGGSQTKIPPVPLYKRREFVVMLTPMPLGGDSSLKHSVKRNKND